MQYLLGFVCEPAPNVKKSAPPLYLFISFHHRVFIYWHRRQTAGYWLCALPEGFVWKGDPSPLRGPPMWRLLLEKALFSRVGPSGCTKTLSTSPTGPFHRVRTLHTHKKQSLIQQRNLNPNTAKSNIHCETCFSGELEKLPFPWKALNYDSHGVFVRLEGKRQVGGKARGKTCQPIIHFFHWYTVCTAGLTEI